MIRDPSDGSVREKIEDGSKLSAPPIAGSGPVIHPETSGLPLESKKSSYQEKLERSREWLRKYRTDPESVVRRTGETGDQSQ